VHPRDGEQQIREIDLCPNCVAKVPDLRSEKTFQELRRMAIG
jgi:hypothetical protein